VQEGVIQWLRSAAAALAIAAQISVSLPADAVLYSPDTKIPRTGELALRKAIPANPSMKIIQILLSSEPALRFAYYSVLQPGHSLIVLHLAGISGGYLVFAEDTTEEAVRYHGGRCEEIHESKLSPWHVFLPFLVVLRSSE